jgi:hypothetical protein
MTQAKQDEQTDVLLGRVEHALARIEHLARGQEAAIDDRAQQQVLAHLIDELVKSMQDLKGSVFGTSDISRPSVLSRLAALEQTLIQIQQRCAGCPLITRLKELEKEISEFIRDHARTCPMVCRSAEFTEKLADLQDAFDDFTTVHDACVSEKGNTIRAVNELKQEVGDLKNVVNVLVEEMKARRAWNQEWKDLGWSIFTKGLVVGLGLITVWILAIFRTGLLEWIKTHL